MPDRLCTVCGSLERHRLLWMFLAMRTDFFTARRRMLHVAPEPLLGARFAQMPNIDYLSADLGSPLAMVQMDITDIDMPGGSFDVVFANHVLEHIPDDVAAMSELRRVLSPDGWAILDVPMFGSTTREDPTVTDPDERTRRFGQHDHVRMYGHDGVFAERLTTSGFQVEVVPFAQELGPAAIERYGLSAEERIHLCRPRMAAEGVTAK